MATFAQIDDSTQTPRPTIISYEHLGKRLLRLRGILDIHINDAALALQVDSPTIRSIEAGDAIPPRLSSRLRTYLAQLEARVVDAPAAAPPVAPSPQKDDRPSEPTSDATEGESEAVAFATWVKAQRKALGWTLKDLATRADISVSTVHGIEAGGSCIRATRQRIEEAFNANPPTQPTHLPATESWLLRQRFVDALLDRKVGQYLAAAQMDAPRANIRDMMKDPFYLIPVSLGAKISAWLETPPTDQPLPTEAPVTATVPTIDETIIADSLASTANATADQVNDFADCFGVPQLAGSPNQDADGDSADETPTPDLPGIRMLNRISINMPRPPRGEFALTILLDKLPSYPESNHPRWFDSFDLLTKLALSTATQADQG